MERRAGLVDDLPARLKHALAGRATIDVAQFQFIGLAEVAQAYGKEWPQRQTRIFESANSFLKERVDARDILIGGADGFLLVLASMTGAEARTFARQLSEGLTSFLLGEHPQGAPGVKSNTRSMSRDDLHDALARNSVALTASHPMPARSEPPVWVYQPIWNVRRQALTIYFAAHDGPQSQAAAKELDNAALLETGRAMTSLFKSGRQAIVGASVSLHSLSSTEARTQVLGALDSFEPALLRYRQLRLCGLTSGTPRIYVSEAIGALRTRVTNIAVAVPWDEPDISGLLQFGGTTMWLTAPAPDLFHHQSHEKEILAKVKGTVEAAHAQDKTVGIEGEINCELATKLMAVGVGYMSSPLIWPRQAAPDAACRWLADRLTPLTV